MTTIGVKDRGTKKRMPRADRERQLLDVAEQMFAERGFAATSMDELAQRAGVTKPVVYDHFGSKDGVLAAGIARGRAQLAALTLQAVDGVDDAGEALRRALHVFFAFVAERGRVWTRLMGEAGASGVAGDGLAEARAQQAALTALMLAQLHPERDQTSLAIWAEAIVGACERLSIWWGDHPEISTDEITERLTALLLPGLA